VTYTQVLGIVRAMTISWPKGFLAQSQYSEFFLLDLSALRLNCMLDADFTTSYSLHLLALPAFLASILLCHGVQKFASLAGAPRGPLSFDKSFWFIGQVMTTLFISLARTMCVMFECYNSPNGKRALRKYPSVECGSAEYDAMLAPAIISFSVFVLAPCALGFYFALRAPRLVSHNPRWEPRLLFLLDKFRPPCWWFGPVMVLRSLFMTLSLSISPDSGYGQFIIGALVLNLYGTLVAAYWPFKYRAGNIIELVNTTALLMILVLAVPYIEASSEASDTETLATLLVVLLRASWAAHVLTLLFALDTKCRPVGSPIVVGFAARTKRITEELTKALRRLRDMEAEALLGPLTEATEADLQVLESALRHLLGVLKEERVCQILASRSQLLEDAAGAPAQQPPPVEEEQAVSETRSDFSV